MVYPEGHTSAPPRQADLVSKDDLSAERQAFAQPKSAHVMEVVSIGRVLFKDGEPSDPELPRRYRL